MALNKEAIGKTIGPISKDYSWKDCVLYALGVGAGFSNLEYCYEKDLKVIPSFSIASIFEFLSHIGVESNVNLAGILHGEQELIFHNPIPTEGTLTTEGRITNYYDKGADKGALVMGESETTHSNGEKLFTSILTIFSRLDGGFGGADAPKKEVLMPAREPDFVAEETPGKDQPLLYRLSGDIFPLHADPEFAKMSGFEKPIMHGLCTHGYACRTLIDNLIPGEPEKARRMVCRFSKTIYPGTPIKILIWKTGEGTAVWQVVNPLNNEIVINMGEFEYGDIPKTEIRFDDQVAIITGAGGGLGRTYALELARRGASVVVNDLGGSRDGSGAGSSSPADVVVAEIKAAGGKATANYDNVATVAGGANLVKTAVQAFGKVDILVNNAGILRDKSFIKMEPANWQAVMDVHLGGAYNVTRPAYEIMKANGYGRIVMTSSAAGLYGNFGQTNYSAAKMALVGFMNTLKLEGAKSNVKVNTIAPIAASRLTEDILPPDMFAKMDPAFVSAMTLYLCSQECQQSGGIYNAGMGYFNRAAIMTGPGMILGQGEDVPAVEEVDSNLEKFSSLKNAKVYGELNAQVGDLLTAFEGPQEDNGSSDGFDSVAGIFDSMADYFQKDAAAGVDVIFQYKIVGVQAGDWHCLIKDQTCTIVSGQHAKPTTTIKMDSPDFLDMSNGKASPMQLFSSGKLKIEGDVMKSQLLEKLFKM